MIGRSGNFRMALESLRAARWRSMLTMLGIIIGIVSVVTTVSLGEGAKRAVVAQVEQSGIDLITVRPGKVDTGNAAQLLGGNYRGSLGEADYLTIKATAGVGAVAPFSFISTSASKENTVYDEALVVATTEDLPTVLDQELAYGGFFSDDEPQKNAAVIGQDVAEKLFGENVPIGKYFTIRGKDFVVRGIFDSFETSPLVSAPDYNKAVFIQYETGKELLQKTDIYQVLLKPQKKTVGGSAAVASAVQSALEKAHGDQQDFTVLTQSDNLKNTNHLVSLLTGFIAGIAAISLVVAGIGILNIMLVSVVERTHEIGIRKAIGATNQQILSQFLTEAVILSILGGFVGAIMSLLVNYLLRIFTDLTPVITPAIMLLAFGISVIVGIIFGVAPALTAARKRPIDALRHE